MPTASNGFDWTEQAVARLRALWADGHSTAEIGRRLGVSKNSVVGKVRRHARLFRHDIGRPARPEGMTRTLRLYRCTARHPTGGCGRNTHAVWERDHGHYR